MALAKSRTWRALTTTAGRRAAQRAATAALWFGAAACKRKRAAARGPAHGTPRGAPAGRRVGEARPQAGGADVHIEVVLADIDADEGAVHEVGPLWRKRTTSEAEDFPVLAGECGLRSGDYSNAGKSPGGGPQLQGGLR